MKYLKFTDVIPTNLPEYGVIREEKSITDMDGMTRETYVIQFSDRNEVRIANFDKVTGEYLGESAR